jgi:hypothetical protein
MLVADCMRVEVAPMIPSPRHIKSLLFNPLQNSNLLKNFSLSALTFYKGLKRRDLICLGDGIIGATSTRMQSATSI